MKLFQVILVSQIEVKTSFLTGDVTADVSATVSFQPGSRCG